MNATSTQEERLVLALRQRHSSGFSHLYDAYAPALYGVILRLVKDPAWAEDLLQDTFVKIWLNHERYDSVQGHLFNWMVRIARNVALDALRAQKVRRVWSETIGHDDETITHPTLHEGMVHHSLLSQLAPKYQAIVELLYYRGYTGQEVATALNLPLGTVKTRAHLALQQLKLLFSQDIRYYQAG